MAHSGASCVHVEGHLLSKQKLDIKTSSWMMRMDNTQTHTVDSTFPDAEVVEKSLMRKLLDTVEDITRGLDVNLSRTTFTVQKQKLKHVSLCSVQSVGT